MLNHDYSVRLNKACFLHSHSMSAQLQEHVAITHKSTLLKVVSITILSERDQGDVQIGNGFKVMDSVVRYSLWEIFS